MESLVAFTVLVALVGLERVVELVVSVRNAAWSRARGGVETGLGHYPFMVVLHTGLLVGALVEAWVRRPEVPAWLAWSMTLLVLASQALRWWCIGTLGRRWNTRVIVVPGLAPVTGGPYRWMRHPNYVAVVVEGVALPLVHASWITAVVFTVLNAGLLAVRIKVEDEALASLPSSGLTGPSMRDLVVVGGGPIGLATALYADPGRARRRGPRAAAGTGRQGVRRGPDAGSGGRARRPGHRPAGPPDRRDPLRRRASVRRRAVHGRARTRRTADRAARCPVRGRRPRGRARRAADRAVADPGRRRGAGRRRAGEVRHRRRRPALDRPPAGRARGSAPGPPQVRAAPAPGDGAVDAVRGGALVAARRGVRDAGRRRLRRRGRARRRRRRLRRPADQLPRVGRAADRARRRRGCSGPGRCGSGRGTGWPAGCCWSATRPATSTR